MYWSADPVWYLYVGIPSLGVVVIAALLTWVYATQRERRGARWFVVMIGSGGLFLLVQIWYLLETNPGRLHALLGLQIWLAMTTFAAFMVFVSAYTGRGYHRRRPFQAGLAFLVGGSGLLALTDGSHDLLVAEPVVVSEPFPYVQNEPGVGFVAVVAVLMTLVGYSWFVLVYYVLETEHRSGWQLLSLLLGAFAVAVAEVVGRASFMPAQGFHHLSWGILVFAVFSTFALFKFRLLAVPPVARNAIVEELDDPILILDDEKRLVDHNRASADVWPAIGDHVGDPIEAAAPTLAERLDLFGGDAPDAVELRVDVDGEARHYSASVTPVSRGQDEVGWYAVGLRDVTAIERSRRRLETQNERLDQVAGTVSHDLRNPIQVASGYLDLLASDVHEAAPGTAATETLDELETTFEEMTTIIEDVLTLVRYGAAVEDPEPVSLSAAAREAWERADPRGARLEIETDRRVPADRERLVTMFEHLFRTDDDRLESSTLDADERTPTVTITGQSGGFAITVDGPGDELARTAETFEYGPRIDEDDAEFDRLLVRTIAEAHGWSVRFEDDEAETRVVVTTTGADDPASAGTDTALGDGRRPAGRNGRRP